MDLRLEVVVLPVSDVDRAKDFYRALGWREDADLAPAPTTYDSASVLAEALRRAAAAHGKHEEQTGQPDPNWPDWYATYMVDEQTGPTAGS
jgi:catechol 2,3-dioxygenase-like lactoylglutathione lyase family enzyme